MEKELEINEQLITTGDGCVETVMCMSRDITQHKAIEKQLKRSLMEKELLPKEIHHRVKNNLQIISSLLNLQSVYIRNPETQEIFSDSQNRIKTMAYIHEKLYQSKNLARIDFSEYLSNLTTNLFRSYKINADNIILRKRRNLSSDAV